MKFVIFDFEVFRYDALLGALEVDSDYSIKINQFWDLEQMKRYYALHEDDMWVGHNNIGYDNIVLDAILHNQDPYKTSKSIVNQSIRKRVSVPKYNYDTMRGFYSLKITEYVVGKNISESEVDFDLDRRLTDEEKRKTESYNKDDLMQTYENFMACFDLFELRLEIMNEFHLPYSCLNVSGTKLAAIVLGSKQIPDIESMVVKPKIYDSLRLKNKDVLDYYLNDKFRTKEKLKIMLCGTEHILGSGGIHAAKRKCFYKQAMYFDVSGYYNLIMINLGLLPRTMPKESKELYTYMYHEQLRLKKINPRKRAVYKTILLSVFGAMMNEYTDFYDPWNGLLVTISGQIFLVDLLEKLEGLCEVIQSNTDGIMLDLYDWGKEQEVIKIVEEWESRTGFVIKKEKVFNLTQRDVNNYCCLHDGEIVGKGEVMGRYNQVDKAVVQQSWGAKEALVITQAVVDYFIYNKLPEQTIDELKSDLRLFQFSCKPLSYDYVGLEIEDQSTGEITREKLQNVNRVFASNDFDHIGVVYKYKNKDGKETKSRIAGLPDNMFVYNGDIRGSEIAAELDRRIDFNYYIKRSYERIAEFIDFAKVKDIS